MCKFCIVSQPAWLQGERRSHMRFICPTSYFVWRGDILNGWYKRWDKSSITHPRPVCLEFLFLKDGPSCTYKSWRTEMRAVPLCVYKIACVVWIWDICDRGVFDPILTCAVIAQINESEREYRFVHFTKKHLRCVSCGNNSIRLSSNLMLTKLSSSNHTAYCTKHQLIMRLSSSTP